MSTVVRDMPSCSARSRVEGSLEPGGKPPSKMAARNCWYSLWNRGEGSSVSGIAKFIESGYLIIPNEDVEHEDDSDSSFSRSWFWPGFGARRRPRFRLFPRDLEDGD